MCEFILCEFIFLSCCRERTTIKKYNKFFVTYFFLFFFCEIGINVGQATGSIVSTSIFTWCGYRRRRRRRRRGGGSCCWIHVRSFGQMMVSRSGFGSTGGTSTAVRTIM